MIICYSTNIRFNFNDLHFLLTIYICNTQTLKHIKMKDKHITLRLTSDTYQTYVEKALKRGQKEKRIVKISEVLREVLENGK
nr:hypothetical protein [uncultured archaeon]